MRQKGMRNFLLGCSVLLTMSSLTACAGPSASDETETGLPESGSEGSSENMTGEDVGELSYTGDDAARMAGTLTEPETELPDYMLIPDPPAYYLPGYLYLLPGYRMEVQHPVGAPERTLSVLNAQLCKLFETYDGIWSACVIDLTTGERTIVNDIPMPSASTLKLFILGAVYDAIDKGELERTAELVDRMNSMIRASSNEAANRLIAILGGEDYAAGIARVNQYIEEQGYTDMTRAYNPFQDSSLTLDSEHTNQTSARDCADLLQRIYHRTFGRRKVCNEVEEMLLSQETRYKLPKGIPEESSIGNKTGETDDIENDIAVVYTPVGDYVIAVFSTAWEDKKLAQSRFAEISREVYSYFTDPAYIETHYPSVTLIEPPLLFFEEPEEAVQELFIPQVLPGEDMEEETEDPETEAVTEDAGVPEKSVTEAVSETVTEKSGASETESEEQ